MIRPSSWRVSQSPIRVVIIIIMDHIIIIIDKWRLHAIFSDPRVWINRGSTADQHGSTWISRLQPAVLTHASCVMRQTHASCVMRQTHASCVMRQTHASCVHVPRPFSPFSRRPLSVMTTTGTAEIPMLLLLDLRPLRCTAWGNRVVLPTPYSAMGTNKNSGRRSFERRPLFLLIRKRPA